MAGVTWYMRITPALVIHQLQHRISGRVPPEPIQIRMRIPASRRVTELPSPALRSQLHLAFIGVINRLRQGHVTIERVVVPKIGMILSCFICAHELCRAVPRLGPSRLPSQGRVVRSITNVSRATGEGGRRWSGIQMQLAFMCRQSAQRSPTAIS